MALIRVNVHTVELEPLDEAGFRHAGTSLFGRLGARRIGAGVYEAEAGIPIWPYHYHYGVEEWLYVLDGAPVLREPAGERALAPGDLICFVPGPSGAHTLQGPGRFVIFDADHTVEPYMCVYPDSDKISVPGGILRRDAAVQYWDGEGTAGALEPAQFRREPGAVTPQPSMNAAAAGSLRGDKLEATVVEIAPGERAEPYQEVYGREQWLLVLAGAPTVRHPEGEETLEPGDAVCFVEGPAGARELRNDGGSPVRALLLSTIAVPYAVRRPEMDDWVVYPDGGTGLALRAAGGGRER